MLAPPCLAVACGSPETRLSRVSTPSRRVRLRPFRCAAHSYPSSPAALSLSSMRYDSWLHSTLRTVRPCALRVIDVDLPSGWSANASPLLTSSTHPSHPHPLTPSPFTILCTSELDDGGRDDTTPLPSRPPPSSSPPLCPRCSSRPSSTVQRHGPLCRDCFLSTFSLRFKQTLRRLCHVPPASRVCVAWSGGLCSTALARLLLDGCADVTRHRLLLTPHLTHVDCSAIKQSISHEQREAEDTARDDLLCSFDAPYHVLPLSAVYEIPPDRSRPFPPPSPLFTQDAGQRAMLDERLRRLFRACASSSHQSLLRHLIAHLLSYFTRCQRWWAVVSGESSTTAAAACVTAILSGQGSHVHALSVAEERRLGTRWAYPLRDATSAAVAHYFHFRHLQVLPSLGPIHIRPPSSSSLSSSTSAAAALSSFSSTSSPSPLFPRSAPTLSSAAAAFISRLDALYPQTVSNVLRTVEKVEGPAPSSPLCPWCGHRAPDSLLSSSTLLSTASLSSLQQAAPSSLSSSSSAHASSSTRLCYDCARSFAGVMAPGEDGTGDDDDDVVPACIRRFNGSAELEKQSVENDSMREGLGGTEDVDEGALSPGMSAGHAAHHQVVGQRQRQSRSAMRAQIAEFLLEEKRSTKETADGEGHRQSDC